jgi:hypothetical protein
MFLLATPVDAERQPKRNPSVNRSGVSAERRKILK